MSAEFQKKTRSNPWCVLGVKGDDREASKRLHTTQRKLMRSGSSAV